MKKLLLTILLISTTSFAANKYCPCPGACCPAAPDSMIDIANYLWPWVDLKNDSVTPSNV